MTRISKAEREAAIVELRACADAWAFCRADVDPQDPLATQVYVQVIKLPWSSWYQSRCCEIGGSDCVAWACLEAAALLEDGWNPGDEICGRG